MIDEQRRTTDAILALAEAIKNMPPPVVQVVTPVAEKPVFEAIVPLSQDMGHMGHDSPRPKNAADKVREYLDLHPEDAKLSVRELAEKTGVGKSTVQRVIAER